MTFLGDIIPVPATRNSMEQLSVAEEKLARVMSRLLGVDVFAKKLEMDEERFVPEGLGYKTDLFEEEEKVNPNNIVFLFNLIVFTNYRRKMTLRVDQRRRRSRHVATSRDSPTSSWMPRAGAREEEGSAKKSLVSTNDGTCLVILSVKVLWMNLLLFCTCAVSQVWSMSSLSVSLKSIFSYLSLSRKCYVRPCVCECVSSS